ncbi:hypothetical protein RA28_10860 [Ruegeria sp. ANG-S4]|uniref:ASCH domain-containing protein n=1 Tax=Ruegeria sp. ANG-S4 TaxID=1577904 RepID=UPI00057F67EE|nr:ASCH domain-containing protein [Ruegeria sp. ANG-S4]KIC44996.1 hypothetical protein RA28_10860 [Ruegeria sp. ANG-S4]
MKQKSQRLAVVDRLFPFVLDGSKTSTIRWREQRVEPGVLTFFNLSDADQTVSVHVVKCTDMPLSEAAAYLGRAEEWPDDIMLDGMREHYPEIELSSVVQVIEFDPPAEQTRP